MRRRQLLKSTAAIGGITGIAGCAQPDSDAGPDSCSEGYRKLNSIVGDLYVVSNLDPIELVVDPFEVPEFGNITARLINRSSEEVTTSGVNHVILQRLSSNGEWINTIGIENGYEFKNDTIELSPEESLDWEFNLSPSQFPDPFTDCTIHTAGTYRFVYWGIGHTDSDLAIAETFIIRDS